MMSYYDKLVKYFTKNKNALMQRKAGDRYTIVEFINNKNIENYENLFIVLSLLSVCSSNFLSVTDK